jgi:hypothetical protein
MKVYQSFHAIASAARAPSEALTCSVATRSLRVSSPYLPLNGNEKLTPLGVGMIATLWFRPIIFFKALMAITGDRP